MLLRSFAPRIALRAALAHHVFLTLSQRENIDELSTTLKDVRTQNETLLSATRTAEELKYQVVSLSNERDALKTSHQRKFAQLSEDSNAKYTQLETEIALSRRKATNDFEAKFASQQQQHSDELNSVQNICSRLREDVIDLQVKNDDAAVSLNAIAIERDTRVAEIEKETKNLLERNSKLKSKYACRARECRPSDRSGACRASEASEAFEHQQGGPWTFEHPLGQPLARSREQPHGICDHPVGGASN